MLKLRRFWHVYLLWLIALISLTLVIMLFVSLYQLRERARHEIAKTTDVLSDLQFENLEFTVEINESLPLSLTVPFSDTFSVPISATVPVSMSIPFEDRIDVPVNTVIPVNTQVAVPIPVLGDLVVPIPIVTNVPVSLSVAVPISRSIPLKMDIPVDIMVGVPVESEIPVQATVPVDLSVPVSVLPEELGLNDVLGQLEEAVAGLASILGPLPQR